MNLLLPHSSIVNSLGIKGVILFNDIETNNYFQYETKYIKIHGKILVNDHMILN